MAEAMLLRNKTNSNCIDASHCRKYGVGIFGSALLERVFDSLIYRDARA
jgi:hypothetical protein